MTAGEPNRPVGRVTTPAWLQPATGAALAVVLAAGPTTAATVPRAPAQVTTVTAPQPQLPVEELRCAAGGPEPVARVGQLARQPEVLKSTPTGTCRCGRPCCSTAACGRATPTADRDGRVTVGETLRCATYYAQVVSWTQQPSGRQTPQVQGDPVRGWTLADPPA